MKTVITTLVAAVVLSVAGAALATPCEVSVFVDAAPNRYGSPEYAPWEAAAFAAVADGTFVNMANSINPANVGTTNFEIEDEVVYSFGDGGSRLTWIYWVPNSTIADLTGNFKIALFNDWGTDPTLDFYDDYYGQTWLEPTSWIEYEGGVIGTAGMAWWGAYDVNTQEALDADLYSWGTADETWTFQTDLFGSQCGGMVSQRMGEVPEPVTMVALTSAMIGLGGYVRRRTKA